MGKKSFKNRSVKSISAIVGASALVMGMGISAPVQAMEPFIGQIQMVGFNFAPRGWTTCDGQLLPITSNTALFSLLGTTFGGDGRTTFALPDLRGRSAVHVGNGPTTSNINWGQTGGAENRTLTVANMPSHTHNASTTATTTATLHATSTAGNSANPDGRVQAKKNRTNIYSNATPNVTMDAAAITASTTATTTVSNTGGSQSFSIRDPYLGIYHVIALQGVFPSRH